MLALPAEVLDKLLRDPVMAASAITGVELDWFQNVRLRYNWFVPHKVDSSGWGSGKTLGEWLYAVLRAVLIPGNIVGVYYPIFQTGKEEWWLKNFNNIRHPVLEAQYANGKNEYRESACYRKLFKNGSQILLPAPGFMQDALNQASRSFHTLIVGEYTLAAKKGEGVDELIGRLRGESYNAQHPVWGNHSLLSAHAESPGHPSHRYFAAVRDAAAGKFTQQEQHRNVCYSFCFLDWSDKAYRGSTMKKKLRDDAMITRARRNLPADDFRRRLLGLWSSDGRGWYAETMIAQVLRSEVLPMTARTDARDIFVLGQDTAPGQDGKADECAFVVWRIREVVASPLSSASPTAAGPAEVEAWTEEAGGRYFHTAPVFCHVFKNVDAPQISGFIHGLHLAFGFSLIVMDKQGGGAWVYKELIKPVQLVHNRPLTVTPLCTREEPNQSDKQAIVCFFKRDSELRPLWSAVFLRSDDGYIEASHRMFREGFERRLFHWPQLRENRPKFEFNALSTEAQWAQRHLDETWKQATTIRVKTNADGSPWVSEYGFMKFIQQGTIKKDKLYAAMYGYCAVRLLLKRLTEGTGGWEDGVEAG